MDSVVSTGTLETIQKKPEALNSSITPKPQKTDANDLDSLSFPLFPNRINLVGKQGKDHPRATPSTLGNSAQWLVLDQHDLANSRSMLVFSLGFILLCIKLYSKPRFPKETNKPKVTEIVWEEF